MRHEIRFTLEKISRRLTEIEGLVYKQHEPIPPFLFRELDEPGLPLNENADLEADWEEVPPGSYWALPRKNFILNTNFSVPAGWKNTGPTALYLPIGIAGDFSHPEALVYLDGEQYAARTTHFKCADLK